MENIYKSYVEFVLYVTNIKNVPIAKLGIELSAQFTQHI
jgi:hypothetical protein